MLWHMAGQMKCSETDREISPVSWSELVYFWRSLCETPRVKNP